MLDAFVWMFRTDDFKKRLMWLFLFAVGSYIVAFCLYVFIPMPYNILVTAIISVFAGFTFLGYFWELTSIATNCETDIIASNVYSKKRPKVIYKMNIPDFEIFTFFWRGLASIVASIMLALPLVELIMFTIFTGTWNLSTFGQISQTHIICYAFLGLLFVILLPGLFWNYARRNSIFAVWNLPKAFLLLESYPIRYIAHSIMLALVYVVNYILELVIYTIIQPNFSTIADCIVSSIAIILAVALNLYFMHVSAFILGTIAPNNEA